MAFWYVELGITGTGATSVDDIAMDHNPAATDVDVG
jgi:hypothetical protein